MTAPREGTAAQRVVLHDAFVRHPVPVRLCALGVSVASFVASFPAASFTVAASPTPERG
jgi:hypothetical protein